MDSTHAAPGECGRSVSITKQLKWQLGTCAQPVLAIATLDSEGVRTTMAQLGFTMMEACMITLPGTLDNPVPVKLLSPCTCLVEQPHARGMTGELGLIVIQCSAVMELLLSHQCPVPLLWLLLRGLHLHLCLRLAVQLPPRQCRFPTPPVSVAHIASVSLVYARTLSGRTLLAIHSITQATVPSTPCHALVSSKLTLSTSVSPVRWKPAVLVSILWMEFVRSTLMVVYVLLVIPSAEPSSKVGRSARIRAPPKLM